MRIRTKSWLASILKSIRIRPSRTRRRWLKKKYASRIVAAGLAVSSTLLISSTAIAQCDGLVFTRSFPVGDLPLSATTADLNGDGLPDLVAANHFSDDVSILLANGQGAFAEQLTFAVGDGPIAVTTGDFNGDGLIDLATSNCYSNDVSVLLGSGDGAFIEQQAFAVGNGPRKSQEFHPFLLLQI